MKDNCLGTLYLFELKKILKSKATLVTFIVLFVIALVFGECEISGNADEETRSKYTQINGRVIDDDFLEEYKENTNEIGIADDSNPTFENFSVWFRSLWEYGQSIKDVTIDDLAGYRDEGIQELKEMSQLSQGEYEYWEEKEKEIVFPGTWHDSLLAYGYLMGTEEMKFSLFLFLIPMGLSIVFASEYQNNTDPIIRASKNGDKRTYYVKILAGLSFGVVGSIAILGSFLGYMILRWGIRGLELPMVLIMPFTSYNMTAGELLVKLVIVIIAGSAVTSAFTLFLSQVMKNSLAVMGTSVGVFLGIFMTSAALDTRIRPLSQFIQMLPPVVIDTRMVYEHRLINIFGRYFTVFEYAPIIYIIFTIVFIVLGRYIYEKQEI